MSNNKVQALDEILGRVAPYMSNTVSKQKSLFQAPWEKDFNHAIEKMFGGDLHKLENAVKGYVRFALDATRLQKRFEKTRQYDHKTYEEAAKSVYHNEDYMNSLYLPGIFLSHYLWPHHYQQLQFFLEDFKPLVLELKKPEFCDVGVGTGFYSRQMLEIYDQTYGNGFDISVSSLNYSKMQVNAFGYGERWLGENRDIINNTPQKQWDFLLSIEVLEHLEDPVTFLKSLRKMLKKGGYGFISAALTAANEDHIYLYNTIEEVISQLNEAGFKVLKFREDKAYEPKSDEPVPRNAAFIVT